MYSMWIIILLLMDLFSATYFSNAWFRNISKHDKGCPIGFFSTLAGILFPTIRMDKNGTTISSCQEIRKIVDLSILLQTFSFQLGHCNNLKKKKNQNGTSPHGNSDMNTYHLTIMVKLDNVSYIWCMVNLKCIEIYWYPKCFILASKLEWNDSRNRFDNLK